MPLVPRVGLSALAPPDQLGLSRVRRLEQCARRELKQMPQSLMHVCITTIIFLILFLIPIPHALYLHINRPSLSNILW